LLINPKKIKIKDNILEDEKIIECLFLAKKEREEKRRERERNGM
jgi:hypothetical protein